MKEAAAPSRFEPIALSSESTVVAEFQPDAAHETGYQSEAELEKAFIRQLQQQAYEYLAITSESQLIANLRTQLERLNKIRLSDAEWERFFTTCVAGANDGIIEKTARIQEDHVQVLKRDDGTTKNIYLIDKANIHNNSLQVLNQYEVAQGEGGAVRANRYDVTVLVNGLPMVHIELKRRGVDIREAFNQINRYGRDSFWAGSGLFEYVQLFVISNGTLYVRFPLSLRNVEDLLFERGVDICHETVRMWWNRFGPVFAGDIRRQRVSRMRGFRHWRWHLDEMYVKLNGEMVYLWRAVDHEGEILESYITRARDKDAALRFIKKALKRHGRPEMITTDGLRSYRAAMTELGNADKQEIGRWANNRVENSHLPFRRRERAMLRFRQMKTLQKFAYIHANVHNHFNLERHIVDRQTFKERRSTALAEWQLIAS